MPLPESVITALAPLLRAQSPDAFWQASLALLRSALPTHHLLLGLPCVGTCPFYFRTTTPMTDEAAYLARLDAVAPMAALLARHPRACVLRLSDQLPPGPLDGFPLYEQFMKPEGWLYSAALLFWDDRGTFIGQLALNRTAAQGDITDAELALLATLHPLINATVQRLLADENRAAAHQSLEHTVQRLPLPMAGLAWDLSLSFANDAAREALRAWQLGTAQARALKATRTARLPDDLHAACLELKAAWEDARVQGRARFQHMRLLSHRGEPDFQATLLLVEPVGDRSLQPSFLLQFARPTSANHAPAQALKALASLTPAERSVADLAAKGKTNAQIARTLNVSESTVRTHLRHGFRKLAIKRRGELGALVLAIDTSTGLPPP